MSLQLRYYQNDYYDSLNRYRWFREDEEEKVKRISGMCYKGDPNFFFIPIAFFPDEKKGEIFASTWKEAAAIKELYINGVKVNKYINRFGVAYHLKPGTYNIKAVYEIAYVYECNSGREFTFRQEDSEETTITIEYDKPYYLALDFSLRVEGTQEFKRKSGRIIDEYVDRFVYKSSLIKTTLQHLKSLSLSWLEYLDTNYSHYHKPDFNKYTPALNTGGMIFVNDSNQTRYYYGYKKNDFCHGFGIYSPKDTSKWAYKGMYDTGWKSGLGFFTSINGSAVFGQFKKGNLNGWGIFVDKDKSMITIKLSNYVNGILHGKEKILYIMLEEKNMYEITYEYQNGKVIWESDSHCFSLNPISYDGGTYYGELYCGVPHGFGIVVYPDGDYDVCVFKNGKPSGPCICVYDTRDEIMIYSFENGLANGECFYWKFNEVVLYGNKENGKWIGSNYRYDLKKKTVYKVKWRDGKWSYE